jgi:endonuclease G
MTRRLIKPIQLLLVTAALIAGPLSTEADLSGPVLIREYPGFKIWHDCGLGGPLAAQYEIGFDTGTLDRDHDFFLDPDLPGDCTQQTSHDTYDAPPWAWSYDRGHLVPANHLDDRQDAVSASNVMTNITPQELRFNRFGAWRETEKRIECWRDQTPLSIWIGVLWGEDSRNDYFMSSHGIPTPDAFVKLVINKETGTAIAWYLENTRLTATQLDGKVISPKQAAILLAPLTGPQESFDGLPEASVAEDWPKLSCDQG